MKVLQFIPSLNAADGGTTTYMQQLSPALGKLCELHVCAMGKSDDFVSLEGCQVHTITDKLSHFRQMKREWISLLEAIQPDVVHINCCWLPQISLVTFWTRHYIEQRKTATKLFLTPHGMLEPWIIGRNYWTKKVPAILLYQRKSISMCDCLVATAEEERNHILQLGWNSKVALVQNGIDVDAVSVKTSWKRPHNLLFMSRIHPKKGLELLIDSLAQLYKINPDCDLLLTIAGEGEKDYVDKLQLKVANGNLEGIVSFVGPVYGNEKWNMIREADIVVLPSYSENYGLIVAEALAAGTPVITTQGTPWQSVMDAHCGWWIKADVPSLYDVLKSLANLTISDMKIMGENARKLAERDCSISSKVSEMYQLYISK